MKQCLVMQHVAFEDLGTFAPVLEEKGFAIRYCPVDEPPTEEEWLAADLAVVLGGAIGFMIRFSIRFSKMKKISSGSVWNHKSRCSASVWGRSYCSVLSPAYTPARARKSAGAAWNSPKRQKVAFAFSRWLPSGPALARRYV